MGRIGSPAQLLDSRLALRVEPGRITSASRIINGTARYTDPLKSGTPRQLQPKYGLTTNGTNEFVELTYVRAAHTTATVLFAVNDLGSAAADRWVAVGGTSLGIDVVWTSDGFDLIVGSDASNYTTYAYNGGALSGFHTVGVTVSGTTVTAYLDGSAVTLVPAATGTGFDGTLPATERVRIGADAADTAANHSNATFDNFEYYDVALPADDMAAKGAMKPGSTSGVTVSAVPLIHYKCEDPVTSATVKNSGSLGASANATITGTVANVRGTVSPVFCWANEVGYTEGTGSNGGAVGELIPRDESNPTKDIAGNDLQYVGQCPRDMVLTSPAVTLNGTSEAVTSNNVVSLSGAATYSIWVNTTALTDSTDYGLIFGEYSDVGSDSRALIDINGGAGNGIIRFLATGDGGLTNYSRVVAGTALSSGAWHHIAAVFDAGTLRLYIDGVDQGSQTDFGSGAGATLNATAFKTKVGTANSKFWFEGASSEAIVYDSALSASDIATLASGGNVAGAVLHWPMCEPSGDIAFDISGNGNDGKLTGTIATMRGGTQNKSDVLVKSGYSVGRWYDGTNDSWSRATLVGGFSRFCVSFFVVADSLASTKTLLSEWNTTSNRSWYVNLGTSGQLSFGVSDDGTNSSFRNSDNGVVAVGDITHIAITFDSGTVSFEKNGVSVGSGAIADTFAYAGNADFDIAGLYGANLFFGTLSQLLVHKNPTAVWSTATKAAIRAAGKPSEIQSIVSGLGGTAWYFPYGDGSYEALQSLPALTHNGASEQRIIPVGAAGIQPTHGPGLLAPGQSLDLYCGQDDAPICQVLAGDLADGIYDFGDGDEADALYKRGDANGEEIAVITPAATGAEQTVLNAWST